MKIIKFNIIIIKLPKGQNEHIQGKSCLIFKKMRKNFRKLMNLKRLIREYKIFKIIILGWLLRNRKIKIKSIIIIKWSSKHKKNIKVKKRMDLI